MTDAVFIGPEEVSGGGFDDWRGGGEDFGGMLCRD